MVARMIQMFCRNDIRADISTQSEIAWYASTSDKIDKERNNQFNIALEKVIDKIIKNAEPDNNTLRLMIAVDKENNKFCIKAQFELKDEDTFQKIERKIQDFYNRAPDYFANTNIVIVKPDHATTQDSSEHVHDVEVTEALQTIVEKLVENAKSHIFVKGLEVPNPAGGSQTCRLYPTAEFKEKIQQKKPVTQIFSDSIKVSSLKISSNGYTMTGHSSRQRKNVSVFIPENLIKSEEQEISIAPSRFSHREISLETELEHELIIARKIF